MRPAAHKKPAAKPARPRGYRWKIPAALAEKYYSREQAAEQLGVSLRRLCYLISSSQIDSIKYGEFRTLIPKASVRMYVAERTGDGLPPPEIKKGKGRGPRA